MPGRTRFMLNKLPRRTNSTGNASHWCPTWRRQGVPSSGSSNCTPIISSPGQCVCAFAECSSEIHLFLLLREAARSAAMRHWRQVQVGAASAGSAVATYSARYRCHQGAELDLQGSRASGSSGHTLPSRPRLAKLEAGETFGTSSIGFDPAHSAECTYIYRVCG